MQTVFPQIVEWERRQRMFDLADAVYAAMTADEWAESEAESSLWDCTLMDDLHEDEEE